MAKLKADTEYNTKQYQEKIKQAEELGFKGKNASNFAIQNTDLQYEAGELPELVVSPEVKHVYIKDDNKGNRVTYNQHQGEQNARDAQSAANLVGGILAVPAAGIAAAPIIGSGIAAGLNGYAAFQAAHPFLATTIDAGFAADGIINTASNNGIQKTYRLAKEGKYGKAALSGAVDVLDLAGAGQLVNLGRKVINPLYRAGHAYVNISPAGYDKPFKKGKNLVRDLLTGKEADLINTKWEGQLHPKTTSTYLLGQSLPMSMKQEAETIATMARDDAWRKYLGLPERYGIYIKNPDGTYSYNLRKINELAKGQLTPDLSYTSGDLASDFYEAAAGHGTDFITGAGGGLTGNTSRLTHVGEDGTKYGIQTITDTWDINPFERPADRIITKWWNKLAEQPSWKLRRRLNKWGEHIGVNEKELTNWYRSLSDAEKEFVDLDPDMFRKKGLSGRIGKWLYNADPSLNAHKRPKFIQTLDDKVAAIEAGRILGGKPFTMKTDIPLKITNINAQDLSPVQRAQYQNLMKELGFEGSLDDFLFFAPSNYPGIKTDVVSLNLRDGGKLNYTKFYK